MDNTRTTRIALRVSEQEKERIEELANEHGVSLSDYIRFVALNAIIQAPIVPTVKCAKDERSRNENN